MFYSGALDEGGGESKGAARRMVSSLAETALSLQSTSFSLTFHITVVQQFEINKITTGGRSH